MYITRWHWGQWVDDINFDFKVNAFGDIFLSLHFVAFVIVFNNYTSNVLLYFRNEEEREAAIKKIEGHVWKNCILTAKV